MIEQHSSLSEKFIKKGFWLYLFSFIMGPIGYTIKIMISSELSVSDLGILYGVISLIILVSAYNDLGLTDALNFYIPKYITENRYDKVKSILIYTFLIQIITGLSIGSFFFFGADFLSLQYFEDPHAAMVLKVFSFFFLGINFFQLISVFFMVVQNTFYNKIIEVLRMLFSLLFIIGLYIFDTTTLVSFSYAWLFGLYCGILIGLYFFIRKYYIPYLQKEKTIWSFPLFREVFLYALTIFVGVQAAAILSQIDMQFIIFFLGTQEAGYYTNYLSIIGIPFLLIGPIFGLLYPLFSEMSSKGEYEKIRIVKGMFQKNFLVISIAFNILFFVFAEVLASILFGEKFIKSGTILQYSILFLFFNFLLQMNFNIMASTGKVKERIYIVTIAIVCSLVTNFLFIQTLGVYGSALASGIGWVIIWILSEYYLGKAYRVGFEFRHIIKNIFFLSCIGLGAYFFILPLFISLSRLESLLLFCIVSALYFGCFALINKKEFQYFISEIKILRKKKAQ